MIFGRFLCFKFSQLACHRFTYLLMNNVKINNYAKIDPKILCARFESHEHFYLLTTTDWTDAQQSIVHHKRLLSMSVVRQSCTNAEFDQNVPCGSRRTDNYSHILLNKSLARINTNDFYLSKWFKVIKYLQK